jgi:hypothetical protein
MVKSFDLNEDELPHFTADLTVRPSGHRYVKRTEFANLGNAIFPAQDCFTDCLCQCGICFQDENGCLPETCIQISRTCMKFCARRCEEG